ncbi:hypothetical protein Adt_09703 [Abeliophyllum distichum]|uniref:Uncharacterized protein n=1 Tax=Abeliophyllum distichum TaxID=126358 RepID=A0ABD1UHW7_9LAMI
MWFEQSDSNVIVRNWFQQSGLSAVNICGNWFEQQSGLSAVNAVKLQSGLSAVNAVKSGCQCCEIWFEHYAYTGTDNRTQIATKCCEYSSLHKVGKQIRKHKVL